MEAMNHTLREGLFPSSVANDNHNDPLDNSEMTTILAPFEEPEPISHDQLKEKLSENLREVVFSGSFSSFGQLNLFHPPGIRINNEFDVALPLNESSVTMILAHSQLAPFGKGTDTIVDTSVRNTWQIDADKVTFTNPRWQKTIDTVVQTLKRSLGVPSVRGDIHAEFYKLLLYSKGAMFKKHKDTEKTQGMFATLVICLPSEHKGGAVCLEHEGTSVRYETEHNSQWNCQYLAWYADLSHEVEVVTQGHRLALVYNLVCNQSDSIPTVDHLQGQIQPFIDTLNAWSEMKQNKPSLLVHQLSHLYTDGNVSLNALKNKDFFQVNSIVKACQVSRRFLVLLACLERHVVVDGYERDPDDMDFDDCGSDYDHEENKPKGMMLRKIVKLDGTDLGLPSCPLDLQSILDEKIYFKRVPTSQSGGGYMGNESADVEKNYQDTVAVIVERNSLIPALIGTSLENLDSTHSRLQSRLTILSQTMFV